MKLWIDADAAPREMKDVVFRAGKRLGVETILVANQSIEAPLSYPAVRSVVVKYGSDAADHYIVANAEAGDVAITADIALASLLVKKSVAVIDPRGEEYDDDNVGQRLFVRNLMEEQRGAGARTGGPAPYGDKAKQAFAAALDRVLTRLRKRR
jgi:uncharacterized protein YaiI (UPF0178 family)